ncbi:VTT domain-containing protein [Loigolactobacillus backii]|uniref:VTT domain-containing protein n=1 Tax=Loigolactobacillus backii TaxID=375175 RepID=UPI0009EDE67C|nr:VTT domain-containing protein [Loigolactobacillus backii]MDA5387177.1 VTT domain-containing protein [Loigolactobacillus backii]MDA5389749.1 VTT domain-containing protein [Loigolactobacillus backii]PIO82309.1 cytochrome O ubiquinol oxidase [Loigolactobacillus backii]PIO86716.1 cytochrome O ubiquinol oxidase [Loigolactobacillus backii]
MVTEILVSILNMNHLLPSLIAQYGGLVYGGLFIIIFVETGLVVFPFLPGDSLLFLSGSIAAMTAHSLNHITLIILLSIAAIAGDSLNFEIGHHFGQHLTKPKWQRWIKPKYLKEAGQFFHNHGNSAIFLGRFMPVIRTLIPFTAGVSKMHYRKFILFNVLGGIAWVSVAVLAGYFFGNITIVKTHFELIMLAIIVISLLPAILISLKRKSKGTDVNA